MDFSWSEEQKTLKKGVIEFALAELNHGLSEREKQGAFSRAEWKKCADFGIQGIVVPREFGGSEKDVLTAALMMEGLGYGCRDLGLIFGINAQIWSVQLPILNFGTEAQKSRYLPAMCAGEMVGAHAMTEPDAGSDAFGLRLQAKRANGGYVLNGEKVYITNGPTADVALIFGKIAAESGEAGITGFLVERGSHAFEVSQGVDKMGMRTAQMGCFRLCDCFVPEENRLGEEGAGMGIFNSSMSWERSLIFSSHIGAMERQLEKCVNYARKRTQFGSPIGKFQSISNRIANMKLRLETSRLILYRTAWLKAQGKAAPLDAALTKLYLTGR